MNSRVLLALVVVLVALVLGGLVGLSQVEPAVRILSLAIILAAAGIIFAFWYVESSRRRLLRVGVLRDAYRAIERVHATDFSSAEVYRDSQAKWTLAMEDAMGDLQLFGSRRIAGLARSATLGWKREEDRRERVGKLLWAIRDELRSEIGQDLLTEAPSSYRFVTVSGSGLGLGGETADLGARDLAA